MDMDFYKETFKLIERFNYIISKIPEINEQRGSIRIETIGFRNYLAELPKMVIQSIRHNVATTMENETSSLKDDLTKAVETLKQSPEGLNIYVE